MTRTTITKCIEQRDDFFDIFVNFFLVKMVIFENSLGNFWGIWVFLSLAHATNYVGYNGVSDILGP